MRTESAIALLKTHGNDYRMYEERGTVYHNSLVEGVRIGFFIRSDGKPSNSIEFDDERQTAYTGRKRSIIHAINFIRNDAIIERSGLKPLDVIKPGCYRHFKGTVYDVLGLAEHSENNEEMVIYYDPAAKKYWVRPLAMFKAIIVREGKAVRRFQPLEGT